MRRHFAFAVFAGLIGCSSDGGGNPATPGDASTNDGGGGDSEIDGGTLPSGPGSLDPTFGSGGILQRALSGTEGFVTRRAVLAPDDGIVFDASYGTRGGIGRVTANGALDDAFAGPSPIGGILRDTFSIGGLVMLPDGKTMLIGTQSDVAQAMRVLPSGEPDPAFPRTSYFGNVVDHGGLGNGLLDTDGSVVAEGGLDRGTATSTPKVFLGRITTDAKFVRFGDSTVDYGGGYHSVQPKLRTADGKFLCVARPVKADSTDVILRIDAMGVIDMTFGTAGEVATPVDYIDEMLPQDEGGFLVFGHVTASFSRQSMARMKSDGTIDTTFGAAGTVALPEEKSSGSALALQADGKILVAIGVDDGTGHTTTVLHRFGKSGALDLTFGTVGTAELPIPGVTTTRIAATVVQKSGRIVLLGDASVAKAPDSFIAIGVRP